MTKELVIEALEQAYEREKPGAGVLHHSDRGSQYALKEYRDKLKEYEMIGSMSRKGNCWDNACITRVSSLSIVSSNASSYTLSYTQYEPKRNGTSGNI